MARGITCIQSRKTNKVRDSLYGKLNVKSMSNQIKGVWYTKDKEFNELPRCGWTWQQQTDMNYIADIDYLKKLILISQLTPQEDFVLASWIDGASLVELSDELKLSRARTHQVLAKALRKLRHFSKYLGTFNY